MCVYQNFSELRHSSHIFYTVLDHQQLSKHSHLGFHIRIAYLCGNTQDEDSPPK